MRARAGGDERFESRPPSSPAPRRARSGVRMSTPARGNATGGKQAVWVASRVRSSLITCSCVGQRRDVCSLEQTCQKRTPPPKNNYRS
eukprot:68126-Chlamydomonas_euryale.AAC.2